MKKNLAVALLAVSSVATFAQKQLQIANLPTKALTASYAQRVDRNMRPIGPKIDLRAQQSQRGAALWTMAWDANNTDTSTLLLQQNVYGPNEPNWFWGPAYNNPFVTNDMRTLNPGTEGKWATSLNATAFANYATAGSVTLVFFSDALAGTDVDGYDSLGGMTGVALQWDGLTNGFVYYLGSGDLAPFGLGVPMPYDGGAFDIYIVDPVTFGPLPVASQICWRAMLSTTDFQLPGTNPSDSSPYQWDDDNPTDFLHQSPAEYYLYDWANAAGAPQGFPQAAAGYFVGSAAITANGAIDLGQANWCELTGEFDLIAVDGSDQILLDGFGDPISTTQVVALGAAGEYQLLHPRLEDQSFNVVNRYLVSYKGSTHLRLNTIVDFTSGNVLGHDLTPLNGDVDGDNEIGPSDFALLSGAFGTVLGDAGYNAFADLDCDEEVGPSDFSVLSSNFGNTGDDDLLP